MSVKFTVTMWGLLFVLCFLLPSLASREHAAEQDLADNEENLIYKIIKRLEKSSRSSRQKNADDSIHIGQCDVSINNSSIIRQKDSIANGAVFLTLFTDVESNQACARHCCEKDTCDMAVFENKEEHACYLFHCQGKCVFSKLDSYISNSIALNKHLPQTPTLATDSKELQQTDAHLDADSIDADTDRNDAIGTGTDSSDADGTDTYSSDADGTDVNSKDQQQSDQQGGPATTTPSPDSFNTTPAAATTTAAYIHLHSVALGGTCLQDSHCKDPKATCSFRQCLCQQGFHQKDHFCRQACPVSSFECQTVSPMGEGIQCVSVDEVCDSITQCADGSDERNCSDSGKPSKGGGPSDKSNEEGHAHQEDKEQESDHSKEDTTMQPEEQSHPDSEEQSSSKEEEDDADQATPLPDKTTASIPATTNKLSMTTTTTTTPTTTPKNQFVSKVLEIMEKTNLRVPIIALSVGLAFTLILLFFVACRLCRVRRQLRKGRPLHSNEADYLINGMYL